MAKYIDLPNLKENLTNFLNKKINPIYAKKTEIPSNVSELNNDKSYQTAEEVGQAVTDGVARIVAGAPEDFDTLKEMSDWISSHETSAAAMNSAISDNSVAIANHTSNSDIHVTKEEKTKWNKLDSDLKDGTIIVAEATKATQDAQGNVIDTTYAKKTEVPQGTVVDDTLSSTSVNPVQNKVVKTEFDNVNSNLDSLGYGDNGACNLLNPTLQTTTIIGVTCTSNGDGTYTLNGTTEGFPPFKLGDVYLEKGTYLIDSFSYDGNSPYLWVGKDGENSNIINQYWTEPLTFTLDSKTLVSIHMVCVPGQNFSDKLMFPMLIKGTSAQKQYKPYIPSVKMLAEENAQQNTEAIDLKMLGWSVPKECPIQNEVNGNQFVQKVGRADMSKLDWTTYSSTGIFRFASESEAEYTKYNIKQGSFAYLRDYNYVGNSNSWANINNYGNKTIMGVFVGGWDDGFILTNNSYTDSASFKQAMQGQYLYYELATPITKTIDGNEKAEQIDDSISSLGKCKNLLKPTLQTTTQNGVTCTNNGDGTYTLNGTADVNRYFFIQVITDLAKRTTNKDYKLVGCPVNGSNSKYDLRYEINGSVNNGGGKDLGNGCIVKNNKVNSADITSATIIISIMEGFTANNLVFKPMLTTNLNATYDDFAPYTGDGDTLTSDVAELKNDLSGKMNCTNPTGTGSFSLNRKTGSTIGDYSFAEGSRTTASGKYSHAEGENTTASGDSSHAEGGDLTTASGFYSHAEGASTTASGDSSHAEGNGASATGDFSHAEGNWTIASGESSHAEGDNTIASNYSSHASGKLNAPMTTGGTFDNTTGTAFVIGNGTSEEALSNAFSVQYDGTVKAKSTITASTTADYAEFFEWLDENPNNEDRVGYFVTLDGNRIKIASDNDDYILGIVSGEPFVLGNGDCDTWNGMYLHDEFRRTIYEPAPKVEEVEIKEEREETYIDEETGEEKTRTIEVVVGHEFKEVEGEFDGTRPKLNPDYDNTQPYVSRFDRKEWSPVGMLGVLAVRHDGTAKVNGYVTVNKNGIATACDKNIENSYRVIKANTDSVVEVIFK